MEQQDSIPLLNKKGKIIRYWTQSEFKKMVSYVRIDSSSIAISRIKSIEEVIINFGDSFYNKKQLKTLNQAFEGLWVSNEYLTTDFAEWVFMMNRSALLKDVNPDNENNFFIYAKPSTEANKDTLDINEFFEKENDTALYKIKLREAKGKWAKVNISVQELEISGWMPWYNFCHNILTTCTQVNNSEVENED